MDTTFEDWVIDQMQERGWSNSELARRAGVVPSTVSMVANGQKRPGLEFCVGVARAFGIPAEQVLRRASLIPQVPPAVAEEQEVVSIFRTLSASVRHTVLSMLRGLSGRVVISAVATHETVEDDFLMRELVAEFEKVPDEWKPHLIDQARQYRRMADTRPRLIGEESEGAREGERQAEAA